MIRLQDVMSTNVKTVGPGVAAEQAWSLMQQQDIHHLIVMDGGDVVGVVSARDLGGARGGAARKNQTVEDLMVHKPVTAKPEDTLRQAANKLRGYAIGCLPIVDGGKVKGIVTITDCLELLGRGAAHPGTQPERRMLSRKQGRPYVQFKKR
jgi:acetoin utilization protein AcuB